MKRIIFVLTLLILLTGCSVKDINDETFNKVINETLQKDVMKPNKTFEGYKYYMPRGFGLLEQKGTNSILISNGDTLYLYVDTVSYFHKKDIVIPTDAKEISYDNNKGYIILSEKENNLYYLELYYNYSKIEAFVKKENIKETLKNSIKLLTSITYNDVILDTIIGEKSINYQEEVYNFFESKREEGNFMDYVEEYDVYEEKIVDEDILISSNE